jgi:epoxyqueuosine reductase
MTPSELTQSLKAEAARQGFTLSGCCEAVSPAGFAPLADWIDAGYAGEMDYMKSRLHAYEHPRHVMDGAVSVLMLGMNYQTGPPETGKAGHGRIARYAWGSGDYHDLIHSRLKQLKRFAMELTDDSDQPVLARGVVDTAPLLEREFAQLAGLGWAAKNTMLINPQHGSWFFLAALLLNVPLEYDQPFSGFHCGTCTACLDACPTDAFVEPGKLDATKCISYLTIEHRSPIDSSLRSGMEDWVLGCDVCQEVCPWNRKAPLSEEETFEPLPGHDPLDLRSVFWLTDDQFRSRFRKTPLWRPRRRGILRNAAIALGNRPDEGNVAALERGLSDSEPLVRGASAWALGRHPFTGVASTLEQQLSSDGDPDVCEEIQQALNELAKSGGVGPVK